MQHLIDNLQYKVPFLIVLATLFLTELFYLLGLPLIFDLYEGLKVMLNVVITCQVIFLLLIRNQLRKLEMHTTILQFTNKFTVEEFKEHTRITTEEELAKLLRTEKFQALQQ